MKVSREASAETRRRIVETAGQLFRARGYGGVGLADIMKQAGLTHGGFYGHFGSKAELAAEATGQAIASTSGLWDAIGPEPGALGLPAFAERYLSPRHRDDPSHGCVLAALGSDAAREPLPVREAFSRAVGSRLEKLTALLPGRSAAARRRKAVATMAGLVGALVLARAVADPALSDEILQTGKDVFGTL